MIEAKLNGLRKYRGLIRESLQKGHKPNREPPKAVTARVSPAWLHVLFGYGTSLNKYLSGI